ncbi:MAG: hypothetical protein V4631_06640 [Pseudomonadota bacterium]
MAAMTFETREVLLTLEQNGNEDDPPIISIKLRVVKSPKIYIATGTLVEQATWTMIVRELRSGAEDQKREPGSLTYTDNDGKGECLVLINQSPSRFQTVVDMFKGGHASEITIVTDSMDPRDDYSSQWDTEAMPRLDVLRVSFEFPLPQSEA